MTEFLKNRDFSILQAIIGNYIDTGEPVGSRYLSKKLDIRLSPATIRNIMADLEEMGYLDQPHISAGRVPTDKAYRFYVDSLIKSTAGAGDKPPPNIAGVTTAGKGRAGDLIRETSRVLSHLSHYIGLVLAPRFINTILKHIEFVKLRARQVLVILVSQEGLIQNKVIITDRDHSHRDLEKMAAALNEKYSNRPLDEVRVAIMQDMAAEKDLYDSLLERAIRLGEKALFQEGQEDQIYVDGTSNVFSLPEFADVKKMKALFEAFEEKSHLVDLLDRCSDAQGVKIFIGAENPYHEMHELSLITAPYKKDGRVFGVIGVLGPTRMEYGRVIPMVSHTALHLSRLLTEEY